MFIVDVQGFQYGTSNFLCKEITILNSLTKHYKHATVKLPFDLDSYKHQVKSHMKWLTDKLHGIEWSYTDVDSVEYENLSDFMKSFITEENGGIDTVDCFGNNDNAVIIAVEGTQKMEWLAKLFQNSYTIIDLGAIGCPSLDELKNIFKSYRCDYERHACNNYFKCTLENAFYLYFWNFLCNK